MEGYLRFTINWASLIAGSKCTVLALFYFVFEANFPSTSPGGLYNIWKGDVTEVFCALLVWGGAYIWRGSYIEGLIFGILWVFLIILSVGNLIFLKNIIQFFDKHLSFSCHKKGRKIKLSL